MQNKPSMRLLPVVMLVIAALIAFKIADFGFGEDSAGGAALAQETEPAADAPDEAANDETLDPEATGEILTEEEEPVADRNREFSAAEREVLESLLTRRQQLDEREREVQLREKLLEAAEKRVEERVAELKAIEARIEQTFGKQEEERASRGRAADEDAKDGAHSRSDGFRGCAAPDGRACKARCSARRPVTCCAFSPAPQAAWRGRR